MPGVAALGSGELISKQNILDMDTAYTHRWLASVIRLQVYDLIPHCLCCSLHKCTSMCCQDISVFGYRTFQVAMMTMAMMTWTQDLQCLTSLLHLSPIQAATIANCRYAMQHVHRAAVFTTTTTKSHSIAEASVECCICLQASGQGCADTFMQVRGLSKHTSAVQ